MYSTVPTLMWVLVLVVIILDCKAQHLNTEV